MLARESLSVCQEDGLNCYFTATFLCETRRSHVQRFRRATLVHDVTASDCVGQVVVTRPQKSCLPIPSTLSDALT